MILTSFTLLRPLWLLALIPWGLITRRLYTKNKNLGHWSEVIDAHLLPHLLHDTLPSKLSPVALFFSLFGLLLIFILSGPSFERVKLPAIKKKEALVIAVDVSEKMLATDLSPSRIDRTKFKLKELLERRREGQTGLVAFSQEAFVASPLSNDSKTLMSMVPEISPAIVPILGQNLSAALLSSANLIKQAGFAKGSILLITAGPATSTDIKTAKHLATDGITTNILAMATKKGAPVPNQDLTFSRQVAFSKLDPSSLNELANAGGGELIISTLNNQDVKRILSLSTPHQGTLDNASGLNIDKRADNGRYFILLLLPFALYACRRGFLENHV